VLLDGGLVGSIELSSEIGLPVGLADGDWFFVVERDDHGASNSELLRYAWFIRSRFKSI